MPNPYTMDDMPEPKRGQLRKVWWQGSFSNRYVQHINTKEDYAALIWEAANCVDPAKRHHIFSATEGKENLDIFRETIRARPWLAREAFKLVLTDYLRPKKMGPEEYVYAFRFISGLYRNMQNRAETEDAKRWGFEAEDVFFYLARCESLPVLAFRPHPLWMSRMDGRTIVNNGMSLARFYLGRRELGWQDVKRFDEKHQTVLEAGLRLSDVLLSNIARGKMEPCLSEILLEFIANHAPDRWFHDHAEQIRSGTGLLTRQNLFFNLASYRHLSPQGRARLEPLFGLPSLPPGTATDFIPPPRLQSDPAQQSPS